MGRDEGAERCELCGAPAAVHCAADAAFLCAACDAEVHGANFLASRHRRARLAPAEGHDPATSTGSCVSTADPATGSCVSTADSAPPPPRGRRPGRPRGAEAVLLQGWARRTGLPTGPSRRRAAAAARAVRSCGPDAAAALRRLEACAHVPAASLVVAVASSMARARARRRPADVDAAAEGWDECS